MKKIIIISIILVSSIIISILLFNEFRGNNELYTENDISMVARTKDKSFQIYKDGRFETTFLKGVNMGSAIPGTFPGELAITKEMYLEWFGLIQEMNADVIRVYTTMMPHFYEALYEFNETVKKPLYIMQGVWLNEESIKDINDAYALNGQLQTDLINDGKDLVDIIHGNASLEAQVGFASGEYTYDVSKYVIGWIIGVEWSPNFVLNTNINNPTMSNFQGSYLQTTEEASPFEAFLAAVGNEIIDYEVEQYQFMRPLSFVNWPTTDHLTHPNEPDDMEDLVGVNMNHINKTPAYTAGYFASFHIYPYYPEFMNYSTIYRDYIDHRGELNAYQGYLKDLIDNLDMPVIVAEFGVPASRGKTHEDINQGFNQGFLSETEQGEIVSHMFEDIYVSDYAGAMVFTWQDEWFKRTWNTMDFDLPHRRPFWSNIQTNEQYFGLLAFDPGQEERIRYVDGDLSDWEEDTPVYQDDDLEIYTAYDERYMYIHIKSDTINLLDNQLLIPMSTIDNQGNDNIRNTDITFSHDADFYIHIQGRDYAEVFVDAYYDKFYYLYHETLELLEKNPSYTNKNTGIFNSIYQALSAELHLPETNTIIPFMKHNTGLLTHGNGHPMDETYNSLSDYYMTSHSVEIQIPWLMLNITDPSTKMRLADLYANDWFTSESVNQIFIGASIIENGQANYIEMTSDTWNSWERPTYHIRLKESYYIIKDTFSTYDD
ncbi:family 2 glycosyl transferase [Mycoplasmatota bacterium]|nr:family 2 glycosyl transferase [Mycoplasmatota bacterium]